MEVVKYLDAMISIGHIIREMEQRIRMALGMIRENCKYTAGKEGINNGKTVNS